MFIRFLIVFVISCFHLLYLNAKPLNLNAKPLDLSLFAKLPQYGSVKLSPDGKYFAVTLPLSDTTELAIIKRKDNSISHIFKFKKNEHVAQFFWVSNKRVIFTRYFQKSWDARRSSEGQIYAGNIDGSNSKIIFGHSAGGSAVLSRRKATFAVGNILNLLQNDPNHIIIESRSFYNKFDKPVKIYKLDVNTGNKKLITRTPFGNISVIVNNQGKPVIASGVAEDGNKQIFLYKQNKWEKLNNKHILKDYEPLFVNNKGNLLYLYSYPENATTALSTYNLSTGKLTKLFQDAKSDITDLITSPISKEIIALKIEPDYPEIHYIDNQDTFSLYYKKLQKIFNNDDIKITSYTKNHDEFIFKTSNDRDSASFYSFKPKEKKIHFLLKSRWWLKPELLAHRKPITIYSRDNVKIPGYLTLPLSTEKNIPLIVLVHGGPYGIRDHWALDFTNIEASMLANNGYAVLQINYRGSGGYGKNYEEIAYQKRSTMIQHDIIDATKAVLKMPEISDVNVCIMGWSFGGYSALMAPLIEPELYKCAIPASGVYDALAQEKKADYSRISSVQKEAGKVYGNDENLLKKESPLSYIDNLKTPLLIVHGGKDTRVPPEQAFKLKAALDKRHIPYEWLFKKNEGHGFINEKNRIEFYQRVIKFLGHYIGQERPEK